LFLIAGINILSHLVSSNAETQTQACSAASPRTGLGPSTSCSLTQCSGTSFSLCSPPSTSAACGRTRGPNSESTLRFCWATGRDVIGKG
jgi:hypothetical protein